MAHRILASVAEVSNVVAQVPKALRDSLRCDPLEDGTHMLTFDESIVPQVATDSGNDPKARLTTYLADKRWQVEVGGCLLNDAALWTDRETQAKVAAIVAGLGAGTINAPIPFKAPGGFAMLSEPEIVAVATAIAGHVQAAFAIEAELSAAIAAGAITSVSEIDAADWPANA